MKSTVMFVICRNIFFGGLIMAGIQSTQALQIEIPPVAEDEIGLTASTEDRLLPGVYSYSKDNQEVNEHAKLLQSKYPNRKEPVDTQEVQRFTKGLLQGIAKRTAFATTVDELNQIQSTEEFEERGPMQKRAHLKEYHAGGCEAEIDWIFLDKYHFPRFIRSYNCINSVCSDGGSCNRKKYTVYVLRMNAPENIPVVDEGCDTHLPQELRCGWKLIPINVTSYCECT